MKFKDIVSEAKLSKQQIDKIFQQAEQSSAAAGNNRTLIGKGKDALGNMASRAKDALTPQQAPAQPQAAQPQATQPQVAPNAFGNMANQLAAQSQPAIQPTAVAPQPAPNVWRNNRAPEQPATAQPQAVTPQPAPVEPETVAPAEPVPAPVKKSKSRKKPTNTNESINLSEFQIFFLIGESVNLQHGLNEGLADYAKNVGRNLTNKVTLNRLQNAWKSEGSPTDSDQIANILRTAGVSKSIIKDVYRNMQIPKPGSSKGNASNTANQTAPASSGNAQPQGKGKGKAPPTQSQPQGRGKAAAGAFNNMANQLSSNQHTSTGGNAKTTPSGITHTASPDNPNNPAQQNTGGGQDIKTLTKKWIQYLKNNQIVSSNSDPKTGELKYNKQPTVDDLKEFLGLESNFSEEQINNVLGSTQFTGAPSTPQSEPAPEEPAVNKAGAGAFGQMAKNLTGPEQTSTGGTSHPTLTGKKHTASPNNPNQRPQPAAPVQAPVAAGTVPAPRKRKKAAVVPPPEAVEEAVQDQPSETVGEDDVEKVFKALIGQLIKEMIERKAKLNRLLELAGIAT